MSQLSNAVPPLGLPDQVGGLPTAPLDRGDETQDRFRYQWAMGVVLLTEGLSGKCACTAVWCEHHEDFLVELVSGKFLAIQVKTDSRENAKWHVTDGPFVKSIQRFCVLEEAHSAKIDQYQFCSNAPIYVPSATAKLPSTLAGSPLRLCEACCTATGPSTIPDPYLSAFDALASSAGATSAVLFSVIRKLRFRRGPSLRGYLDTLIARVIPALPDCHELPNSRLRRVCEELMRLVETASGISTNGLEGALSHIASNGTPEIGIRGKCITLGVALTSIQNAKQAAFRYVGCGGGLPIGHVSGQKNILRKKMRNAFLDGQFEPVWYRALSAEKRLMEKALVDPEGFEDFANQLEAAVLTECKDVEAFAALEPDERKRGLTIFRNILQRLSDMAANEPSKVENEPKETLIGVAGMLSGSCRFAWGVPLEGDDDGA